MRLKLTLLPHFRYERKDIAGMGILEH
jgi:hypothetical protein